MNRLEELESWAKLATARFQRLNTELQVLMRDHRTVPTEALEAYFRADKAQKAAWATYDSEAADDVLGGV